MKHKLFVLCAVAPLLFPLSASQAHDNQVSIQKSGNRICITSNGLPNHSTGRFPNRGNPNSIREQSLRYCVTANPSKGARAKAQRGSVGIALNGIVIRPGTAEYWNPRSRRGISRNRRSGWNVEGIGSASLLGMDKNNAHVDERGLYHYHGVPKGLLSGISGTHIGYAADGFEIHYIGSKAKSGYRLKSGTRPGGANGPGGRYDGAYIQDWEYVGGAGRLDECNGGMLNGKYVYFATITFPFYPRCLWGKSSPDFRR